MSFKDNVKEFKQVVTNGAGYVTSYAIDKISPEKAMLSKSIKDSDFGKYKDILSNDESGKYDDVVFVESNKNGKKSLLMDLSQTHGFSIVFENGKMRVGGDLTPEKYEELAYVFHILGIKDVEFTRGTRSFNDDFAQDMQTTLNKNDPTIYNPSPKYETQGSAQAAKSSFEANEAGNIMLSHVKAWNYEFKRGYELLKWGDIFQDGFSVKFYSSYKNKEKSGDDGEIYKQLWDLYVGVRKNKDNTYTVFYDLPAGKQISEDDATQLMTMMQKAGHTHITLNSNMHALERGNVAIACVKKGMVPVMKPDIPIIYKICIEALDKEVNKDMMTFDEKNEILRKLLVQIKENTFESTGKEFPEEGTKMRNIVSKIEMSLLEGALTKRPTKSKPENFAELVPLSLYTGQNVVKIRKLIDENESIPPLRKIELKKQLITHIQKTDTIEDPAVVREKNNTELEIAKETIVWGDSDKKIIKLSSYDNYNANEILKEIMKSSETDDKKFAMKKELVAHVKEYNQSLSDVQKQSAKLDVVIKNLEVGIMGESIKYDKKIIALNSYNTENIKSVSMAISGSALVDEDKYKLRKQLTKHVIDYAATLSPEKREDEQVDETIKKMTLDLMPDHVKFKKEIIRLPSYTAENFNSIMESVNRSTLVDDDKIKLHEKLLDDVLSVENKGQDSGLLLAMKSAKATIDMQKIYNGEGGLRKTISDIVAKDNLEEVYIATVAATKAMKKYHETLSSAKKIEKSDPTFYNKIIGSSAYRKDAEKALDKLRGSDGKIKDKKKIKALCGIAENQLKEVINGITNEYNVGYNKKTGITPISLPHGMTRS